MITNKLIGQVLLWTGFLAAALTSVSRLEIAEHPWQTIPWAVYAGSMAVGIVGVVLLRASAKAEVRHTERVEGEFDTLTSNLAVLRSNVAELRGQLEQINPHDIVSYIDENCVEPFGAFADARNALVQRFGLNGFADVMTQFASAERFVNRAWSAAADGYVNEASDSLQRAENHLHQASQLMDQFSK
jgi:hypothetical protein